MTLWHVTFIDHSTKQLIETTVGRAPDRVAAVLGALDKVPNKYYHDPIIVVPEYLH